MLRHRPTLVAILACVVMAGCTQAEDTSERSQQPINADVSCPETAPLAPAKLPRALRVSRDGGHWFGAHKLWAGLPTDYDPSRRQDGYFLKYPWVTIDNQRTTAKFGPPAVHAKRIGGPGRAIGQFGGYATTHRLDFWPSGILFPSRGCWVITGKLRGTVVHFVLEI